MEERGRLPRAARWGRKGRGREAAELPRAGGGAPWKREGGSLGLLGGEEREGAGRLLRCRR
jgi:hypothetical protein